MINLSPSVAGVAILQENIPVFQKQEITRPLTCSRVEVEKNLPAGLHPQGANQLLEIVLRSFRAQLDPINFKHAHSEFPM